MKESSQPTDSMASSRGCFYAGCDEAPTWGVESSVESTNPDGSPLRMLTCDDHEQVLTSDMRRAGTKYRLFPVIGPPIGCPRHRSPEDSYEAAFNELPAFERALINCATAAVTLIIAPPMLLYYGVKWVFGWRPKSED